MRQKKSNLIQLKSLADFSKIRRRTRDRWAFSNPVAPGMIDIENQPLYDTNTVAAGAAFPSTLSFFQTPKGQSGKTYLQTNMVNASSLPAPQTMSIRAYRLIVRNDAIPPDLFNFLYNTWLDFWIGTKEYFTGPSCLWTAGAGAVISALGMVGQVPVAGGTDYFYSGSNGNPDQRDVFTLSRPIQIGSLETFYLNINCPTSFNLAGGAITPVPGTGLTIIAVLDGELVKGVQ
jgi:hypothetical protein